MPKALKILIASIIVLLAILYSFYNQAAAPGAKLTPQKTQETPTPEKSPAPIVVPPAPQPVPTQPSLTEPSSLWMVINKKRPLPASYVPANLRSSGGQQLRNDAANQVESLRAAAQKAGAPLKIISGYRSYATQSSLYNSYVQQDGQAAADTYSARPGHSEHQSGLAADLGNTSGQCDLDICFFNTIGGQWLAAHAHEYGFIIRYLNGKTQVTGYQYEPWHIRYVGTELASKIQASGKTMEEYFSLPAAPSY